MSDKYNLVIVSEIVKFPNYFVTKTLLNFMGKIQTVCFKLILGLFMIFISCNKEDKKKSKHANTTITQILKIIIDNKKNIF